MYSTALEPKLDYFKWKKNCLVDIFFIVSFLTNKNGFNRKTLWLLLQSMIHLPKAIVQGKLFQRCAHLLYCSVLSLVIGNYYVNYQKYQNLMLLTSSDTKRTLMHLFLFTNSAQRDLVSICKQSICNCK